MKDYDLKHKIRALAWQKSREYLRNGGRIYILANKANVCTETLTRFIYGETKQPKFDTVVGIAEALGIQLGIVNESKYQLSTNHVYQKDQIDELGRH